MDIDRKREPMIMQVYSIDKKIAEKTISQNMATLYFNSDNFVLDKKTYVIDDKTLDEDNDLIKLFVHQY